MPIDGDISAQHFYANDKMFSSFISSCCHLREEILKTRPILILLLRRSDKYGGAAPSLRPVRAGNANRRWLLIYPSQFEFCILI